LKTGERIDTTPIHIKLLFSDNLSFVVLHTDIVYPPSLAILNSIPNPPSFIDSLKMLISHVKILLVGQSADLDAFTTIRLENLKGLEAYFSIYYSDENKPPHLNPNKNFCAPEPCEVTLPARALPTAGSYTISFGDGSAPIPFPSCVVRDGHCASPGQISHVYGVRGEYIIKLINNSGNVIDKRDMRVEGLPAPNLMVNRSKKDDPPLFMKFGIRLQSKDRDTSFNVDFGDGEKGVFNNCLSESQAYCITDISHTYAKFGVYKAVLTDSRNDQPEERDVILMPERIDFSATPVGGRPDYPTIRGRPPMEVKFSIGRTKLSNGYNYKLDYGDGQEEVLPPCTIDRCRQVLTHTYQTKGLYDAKVIMSGDNVQAPGPVIKETIAVFEPFKAYDTSGEIR
jgi:hypothetical protein